MKNPQEKIRVAVLYGGRSAEHEVSLKSAANVIQNLDSKQFDVVPIGIDYQGNWFLGQEVFNKSIEKQAVSALPHENGTWFAPAWLGNPDDKRLPKVLTKTSGAHFDVIFPAVHGTLCEDGTLQGLLEVANIPYVGCGVLSSAVGMDKDVSKRLAAHAGIPIAPYVVVKKSQWQKNANHFMHHVAENLNYPVFVKPANTGSSIGISKVKAPEDLPAAMAEAFRFDTKVLVEKALTILELEVAVLESLEPAGDPIVSVVGEIKPSHEFYSYDAKYLDENGAELHIPASVSEEVREKARIMAKQLFIALECEGMARVDLFYEPQTGRLYFNEINTLPGFTQISMYPKLMDASGVSYAALLTHLVQLALKRHESKNQLVRAYE